MLLRPSRTGAERLCLRGTIRVISDGQALSTIGPVNRVGRTAPRRSHGCPYVGNPLHQRLRCKGIPTEAIRHDACRVPVARPSTGVRLRAGSRAHRGAAAASSHLRRGCRAIGSRRLPQGRAPGVGRDRVDLRGAAEIGQYSSQRSIVHAFRLRHREGADLAIEALRRWLRSGGQPSVLLAMANTFPRALPPIRQALEVLL